MASLHGNSTSPKPKPPKTPDMVNPSNVPTKMGPATPSQPSKSTYISMLSPQTNTFSPGLTPPAKSAIPSAKESSPTESTSWLSNPTSPTSKAIVYTSAELWSTYCEVYLSTSYNPKDAGPAMPSLCTSASMQQS
ncbi:hypothetical protein ID866_13362 [Astraeus odoratus]|nr:hypothetical protein ID866_13362 [Astraeus odoratus]